MYSKELLAHKANSVVDEMIARLPSLELMHISQLSKQSAKAEHFIAAG